MTVIGTGGAAAAAAAAPAPAPAAAADTAAAVSLSKYENFTNIAMMRNIDNPTLQKVARLAAITALASVIISFAPISAPAIFAKCLPLTMRVSIGITVTAWIIQALQLCGASAHVKGADATDEEDGVGGVGGAAAPSSPSSSSTPAGGDDAAEAAADAKDSSGE
jgi:hypothetical protein